MHPDKNCQSRVLHIISKFQTGSVESSLNKRIQELETKISVLLDATENKISSFKILHTPGRCPAID